MTVKVTLKLATSLDGRIATASGESKWITREAAREEVHRIRARHDAVLVGIETVLADDPMLTVRLQGAAQPQPVRVVLDTSLRLPSASRLATTTGQGPVVVITREAEKASLATLGVITVSAAPPHGAKRPYPRVQPERVVRILKERGLESVMIEGGGEVAASFLRADLVDEIAWFRAPIILGAEGRPAVGGLSLANLAAAPRFRRLDVTVLGDDVLERYERT